MDRTSTQIAYGETGYYTKIILDYLGGNEQLQPFYKHAVSKKGLKAAIEERKAYPTDRKLLAEVLQKHYTGADPTKQQLQNIQLLNNTNCFTITTAHQPNIFTGPLYFIYKILHTIKLCDQLKTEMPENYFVPVFYLGSEDADLEELGHVYINSVKHEWKTNQTGAVGRLKIDKALIKILDDIGGEITIQTYGAEIISLMKTCYTEGASIEQATFKLINALFGDYGLIVLLPDDADYKKTFIPVVEMELKEQFSYKIVKDTVAAFPKTYKVQAGGRDLNMFYLKDDIRERIEKRNGQYPVINTQYSFTEQEMVTEIKNNPERFSPNVILRPVFQEMILPNIAFIGGGGEIAYWLELKNVFAAVKVPFPVLILRNSFLLAEKSHSEKAQKLGFSVTDLFKSEQELLNALVKRDTEVQLSLEKQRQQVHEFYSQLKNTAGAVDITLQAHTEALEKQALRKIDTLEKKMLRAEKKKFEAQQRQLHKLKTQLFPHDNLQERIENFMPFYAKWGKVFLKTVYENSLGLEQEFVVLNIT
jgi:bacillithiol biosynthesis cysteine-adding enzyme BshC